MVCLAFLPESLLPKSLGEISAVSGQVHQQHKWLGSCSAANVLQAAVQKHAAGLAPELKHPFAFGRLVGIPGETWHGCVGAILNDLKLLGWRQRQRVHAALLHQRDVFEDRVGLVELFVAHWQNKAARLHHAPGQRTPNSGQTKP